MAAVDAIEWACVLCGHDVQTNWVENQICIKVWVKLGHFSVETIRMTQKAMVTSNWWLAASSRQHACSCIMITQGDSDSLLSRFGTLQLSAFPQTKIIFEREEISYSWWDLGKYNRAAMVTRRTVWGPNLSALKGTEASLSYVQCFLYLVSSSISVSVFHVTLLDTFWPDLIYYTFMSRNPKWLNKNNKPIWELVQRLSIGHFKKFSTFSLY